MQVSAFAGRKHTRASGTSVVLCVGKRLIKFRAHPPPHPPLPVAAEGWICVLATSVLKWQKYAENSGIQRLISRVYWQ